MRKIYADAVRQIKFNSTGTKCVLDCFIIYHNYEPIKICNVQANSVEFLTEDVVAFVGNMVINLDNGTKMESHALNNCCKNNENVYSVFAGSLYQIPIQNILNGNLVASANWKKNFHFYNLRWNPLTDEIYALTYQKTVLAFKPVVGKPLEISFVLRYNTTIKNLEVTGRFLRIEVKGKYTNIFDLQNKMKKKSFTDVRSFEISSDEKMFLFVKDDCVCLGYVDDWRITKKYYFGRAIYDVKFNPNGETFAVCTQSGAYILDLE